MRNRRRQTGFTLIELVLTLVIIGALAVFAAPRLNIGGFDAANFRQDVVSALRFAQKTAAASRCPVRAEIEADRVSVVSAGGADACGSNDEPFAHPSRGGDFVVQARREATASGDLGDVMFDARGESTDSSNRTIVFAAGGPVTIIAGTGYIDA